MTKRKRPQGRDSKSSNSKRSLKYKKNSGLAPSAFISGSTPPALLLLPSLLLGLFMSPLLAIGGTSCYWAIVNIGQKPFWLSTLIPLGFGVAFISLWFYVLWKQCIWEPAITISRFELIDRKLRIRTPRNGEFVINVDDIMKFYRQPSKRGTAGWWILVKEQSWVYLYNDRLEALRLAEHIEKHRATQKLRM